MKHLEIEAKYSTNLVVSPLDMDKEIEIELKDYQENFVVNTWLSLDQTKELISFLQNQIKDL